jgi:hypothetical protein
MSPNRLDDATQACTSFLLSPNDNPYPMCALAAQLRAIGDQGYALADKPMKVAEEEPDRKR